MKKFKYRAETYLSYIRQLRDKSLVDLKNAENNIRKIESQIQEDEEKMKKALKRNSQFGKGDDNIQWIQDNNQFLTSLRHHSELLKNSLLEAEDIYKDKYKKLLELQTKLKSVEKHKENQEQGHKHLVKKKNQKETDELNSIRHGGSRARSVS